MLGQVIVSMESPYQVVDANLDFASCMFSMVAPTRGRQFHFTRITTPTRCRENLLYDVKKDREKPLRNFVKIVSGKTALNTETTYLFVIGGTCGSGCAKFRRQLDQGQIRSLTVVNALEEMAGWKTRTTRIVNPKMFIGNREHPGNSKTVSSIFVGSGEWQRSPQMLSTYALVIRVASNANFKKFLGHYKNDAMESLKRYSNEPDLADSPWVRNVVECLMPLMKNSRKIFKGSSKKLYKRGMNGVNTFVRGNALDKRSYCRMLSMMGSEA